MKRSIPIIPTIIVVVAAAIMVALGFWQLGRAEEKEVLLARYASTATNDKTIAYPRSESTIEANLYRRVMATCADVQSTRMTAGTNAVGVKGWAQIARCSFGSDSAGEVALGWSQAPTPPRWNGGAVIGVLAPGGKIIADPPLADLGPLAKPDPADLPNNHLAYAGQWFLFALTALVIYAIALGIFSKKR